MVARELGMSVARMRREVSSLEFLYWVAFFRYEAAEIRRSAKGGV